MSTIGNRFSRSILKPLSRGFHSSVLIHLKCRTYTPHFSRKNFCSAVIPKETAAANATQTTSTIEADRSSIIKTVATEEELQEEWKSLERRVSNRKVRVNDGSVPTGRGNRNSSAWDAENV
jgi:hypothetical protein